MDRENDCESMGRRSGRGRLRGVRLVVAFFAVAVTAALVSASVVAAGGGSFSDVPPTNPFFDDIEAVSNACIAAGYPDGTYKPTANVTRQAMAAFLNRTASKTVMGSKTGGSNPSFGSGVADSALVPVAKVTVTTPELPGSCMVPVEIQGTMSANLVGSLADSCFSSCQLRSVISKGGVAFVDSLVMSRPMGATATAPLSTSFLTAQQDGTTVTYELNAQGFGVKTDKGSVAGSRHIHAVIHPMDATPGS